MTQVPFSSPRSSAAAPTFREARDLLLHYRDDYHGARAAFVWPRPVRFNWALDWFDAELAAGEGGLKPALKVIGDRVETRTFADLSRESSRLANGLRALGAKRGDRLLMMLGVGPELWATMLAAMKLGLVLIPAMPALGVADVADRLDRGKAKYLITHGSEAEKFAGAADNVERVAVGEAPPGWRSYDALLGGALNATVSSRVQKLFGAGSVKVDPNYIGTLGNSTSRITVEEQLGRYITLTYATNVDTTGQQLLQAEIAVNRHVSLLVARDESGVFSMVLKATRRYR